MNRSGRVTPHSIAMALVVISIISIAGMFAYSTFYKSNVAPSIQYVTYTQQQVTTVQSIQTTGVNQIPVSGVCPAQFPVVKQVAIKFTFTDPYGGGAFSTSGTAISILDPSKGFNNAEPSADSSSGTMTTSSVYTSGVPYVLSIANTGTTPPTRAQIPFVVPCETDVQVTQHAITVYIVPTPTTNGLAIVLAGCDGTTVANNGSWNVTTKSTCTTTPTFTITINNQDDNTGWPGSITTTAGNATLTAVNMPSSGSFRNRQVTDPNSGPRIMDLGFDIKVTVTSGTPSTLPNNLPKKYSSGGSTVWYGNSFTAIDPRGDMALDKYKLPGTTLYASGKGGAANVPNLQANAANLAKGSTETWKIQVDYFVDYAYLGYYGSLNSEASNPTGGTLTFSLKA